MTVLEILKPACKGLIDLKYDRVQAIAACASGFGPDRIFEFIKALFPWPPVAALKVVSQKVKAAFLPGIDNMGLFRMQRQALFGRPLRHFLQRLGGLFLARHNTTMSSAYLIISKALSAISLSSGSR